VRPAMLYGSVLEVDKKIKQRREWMSGVTREDRISYEYVRESVGVTLILD